MQTETLVTPDATLNRLSAYLDSRGHAKRTQHAYMHDARLWIDWASAHGHSPHNFSRDAVRSYLTDTEVGTQSTAHRRVAALIALSRSTDAEQIPSFSFTRGLNLAGRVRGTRLSSDDIERLTNAIRKHNDVKKQYNEFRIPRDVAFVTLAHFGQLRVEQLLGLQVPSISITPDPEGYKFTAPDINVTVPEQYPEVATYHAGRVLFYESTGGNGSPYLFINRWGDQISARSMRRNLEKFLSATGFPAATLDDLRKPKSRKRK